jgi:predicted peptidase
MPSFRLICCATLLLLGMGYTVQAEPDYTIINPDFARRVNNFAELKLANGKEETRYRLYIPKSLRLPDGAFPKPESLSKEKRFPLLVWLHGVGEAGTENWRQLTYIMDEVETWENDKGPLDCFILALQCPREQAGWGDSMLDLVIRVTEKTAQTWPIDRSRIYLAGVSAGGSACWKLAARQPDTFAAMSPMASAGSDEIAPEALAKIPVWAFHVTGDRGTKVEQVRRTVAEVSEFSDVCWLTEIPGQNHNCWTVAFRDYNVLGWLLQQRQGEPVTPVPSSAQWQSFWARHAINLSSLWPWFVWIAVIGTVGMAIKRQVQQAV